MSRYLDLTTSSFKCVLYGVNNIDVKTCHIISGDDPRKWYPKDGGWEMHVVSTVSEWIVATSFCVYILSFVQEFRTISIEEPQVRTYFILMTCFKGESFILNLGD